MQKGRVIRIGLTLAIFGVVIWTVAPYVTSRVSTSAVVNAPLSPIVAPFNGRVAEPSKPVGARVQPDELLFKAVSESPDRRYQSELEARTQTLQQRLAAVARQRTQLEQLAEDLHARQSRYRSHALKRLRHEIEQTQAALEGARAEAKEADAALARSRNLQAKGLTPNSEHDERVTVAQVARARVNELQARLDGLTSEVVAAREGTFVRAGVHDVPYSQQRADEVALRLSELARSEARLAAELSGARHQLAEERARRDRTEAFRPTAPMRGVVWSASGVRGDPISTGQVVLQVADCEQRFVEVAVSEGYFEAIQAGDIARVHLKGSDRTLRAPVIAVRGAGARKEGPNLAARVPQVERGQLRVLVSLEGVGLDRSASTFCNIGRTAEVYFSRDTSGMIGTAATAVRGWAMALWQTLDSGVSEAVGARAGPGIAAPQMPDPPEAASRGRLPASTAGFRSSEHQGSE
ncbi:HlyD family secretion protein [Rhodovibrio salinarum]|nr:HlyD family efflux transporter periplasmic adaptor subunit [Rhodovibrio salinarum]